MTKIWMMGLMCAVLGSTAVLASEALPDVVAIREISATEKILTDAKGLTLYTFDVDKGGVSACYNGCAKAWPPFVISAEQAKSLTGEFSTTARQDGSLQVRYEGLPLYFYAGDDAPGDLNGDGIGNVWHIVQVDED